MIEKVYTILAMLIAQFVLGMGENVLGEPGSKMSAAHNVAAGILLGLHGLITIGMIIAAVQIWQLKNEHSAWVRQWSERGFGGIGLALVCGILTLATPWREVFSFLMALGFIVAFVSYGLVLLSVSSKPRTPKGFKQARS